MKIIRSLTEWHHLRSQIPSTHTVGLVTTMGNLHVGHLSLLKRSIKENDITVLSIYVNPMQFNDPSDLANYPRTEQRDLALATQAGVDYVLIPSDQEIYPPSCYSKITTNHPLSQVMEGQFRPGHFDGVLTVVMKLLMLVKPNKSYFGEKDFQQLALIKDLVNSFFFNTEIVGCSTMREESELPFSSRNNRLSPTAKQHAAQFSQILQQSNCIHTIRKNLLATNFHVDYVEQYENRIFAAVKIDDIRLIDNREIGY